MILSARARSIIFQIKQEKRAEKNKIKLIKDI
jgi:hypothetical protein